MSDFRKYRDYDFDDWDDERVLQHILSARAHGEHKYTAHVLRILIWRYWDKLVAFVKLRTPPEVADEIAEKALEGALGARFDGSAIEELRGLIFRIARNKIADYFRGRRQDTLPLPEEHLNDEEIFGPDLGYEQDHTEHPARWEAIKAEHETLQPRHQLVVWLCLIVGFDSDSAATEVNSQFPDEKPPMSQNNVDQIKRRFKEAVKKRLDDNGKDSHG